GDIAAVMQHTQKDGFSSSHNSYAWDDDNWSAYYAILRNNDELYNKAVELNLEFHQGIALVMKSYVFGLITDLWGDAPYTSSLKGELGGEENIKPVFDPQSDIYTGILADLETANTLLSKSQDSYSDISPIQDALYAGDVTKWRKFANSLALRYYMRLSAKTPSVAQQGIEKITGDPSNYPLITTPGDDASIAYPGNSAADAWPNNVVFDGSGGSSFRRLMMCSTLIEKLQSLSDPRIGIWAQPIDIQIIVDESRSDGFDEIIDGVRFVAKNVEDQYISTLGFPINSDPNYVGLPPAWSNVPQAYNLNPNLEQAPDNPHASHLNDRYKSASGPLLKARMLSASEIHFILAEAALMGWNTGSSAGEHYNEGIRSSFTTWGVDGAYSSYINNEGVQFDGSIEQIIEQKWIASWTAAGEAWFDYRRTGLPNLQAGVFVNRDILPIRLYYSLDEIDFNPINAGAAISKLESTDFTAPDGNNSAWSKMWLLQGTGKPW
ncbi:MAG: hypothetical protein ACJA01_000874, partial [Saprospiraceae bacterium]